MWLVENLKLKDELPFVAHIIFLFSTVLEDNGVMYSKFGGKVMPYLEIYSQIINQARRQNIFSDKISK